MTPLLNTDLLSVGIAVAANLILGFVVFFQQTRSATRILFLLQTVTLSLWSSVNYLSYQINRPDLALLSIRLVLFFAVLQVTVFLLLMHTFPNPSFLLSKGKVRLIWLFSTLGALLTFTPLVFKSVKILPHVAPQPVVAPGIALFALITVSFVVSGIIILVRKYQIAQGEAKAQFKILTLGVTLMFGLIIVFNFIFPSFFNNTRFIPLSAIFTLPFVAFTAYAIVKHKLLDVKVFSTEILTFVLTVAIFVEVILSNGFYVLLFRSSVFVLVLGFGILLIKSVVREVKQREELQILTKKLEEANVQLQMLDKARAEFISIASHQLRTPPTTIKWYIGAILDGDFGQLTPDIKAALDRTQTANNAQISLIDDLLNVSRIERGKLEFLFEQSAIEPLVQMTVEQLTPMAGQKKLQLVYKAPATSLPQVMSDKEKIRQVVNNMIDNAIKYTSKGSITVSVGVENDNLVVRVKDTGKGIAKGQAESLFEKYNRGKDSIMHATGLGLGLYVAKVIMEQHRGKIWAESEGEGKGSTFALSLPIHNNLQATSLVDLVKGQEVQTGTT